MMFITVRYVYYVMLWFYYDNNNMKNGKLIFSFHDWPMQCYANGRSFTVKEKATKNGFYVAACWCYIYFCYKSELLKKLRFFLTEIKCFAPKIFTQGRYWCSIEEINYKCPGKNFNVLTECRNFRFRSLKNYKKINF